MAQLKQTVLLKILERLHETDQEFYITHVKDTENTIAYRYKLKEIASDGKNYLLHVGGYYISDGGMGPKGTVYGDDVLVNLSHIVEIRPIAKVAR